MLCKITLRENYLYLFLLYRASNTALWISFGSIKAFIRVLVHNSLNQLLYYTDIKESCLFVAEIVETLDPNN